jgi:hypothetical protein
VARAVHHAHQRGLLHRDLKPGNILLDSQGEPHITDFGLARRVEGGEGLTQSGAILGTPGYMAPEQAAGTKGLTTAADVWALGAILYECLTGRPPFVADSPLDALLQTLKDEPKPPSRVRPGVPRDLETVCLKCLAREPERRYGSALEVAEELERWLGGEPVRARAVGRWGRAVRWARRHPAATALTAVSLAALLAAAVAGVGLVYSARLEGLNDELQAAARQAEAARREAERAQADAEEARGLVERLRYFSDMQLAQRAEEDREYQLMSDLLHDHRPGRSKQPDLPGFEWHYLSRQCRLRGTVRGHTDWVTSVAYSPDGKRLASASRDHTVKVWDGATAQLALSLKGHTGWVHSVAWSPDGKRLASASEDGTVRVWDAATGKQALALTSQTTKLRSVSFSPDGKRLASASADGTVRVWDATTSKQILALEQAFSFPRFTTPLRSVAWSPDGKRLASPSEDGAVRVWDAATG